MTRIGRPRFLRILCLSIIGVATLEFLVATVGYQILRLPHSTDFGSYYLAGVLTREGHSPYDEATLIQHGYAMGLEYEQYPFLYPPPFALAMIPLAHLSYPRARQAWMVVLTLALLGALGGTIALVRIQARALGLQHSNAPWVVLAAFFPAALNSTSVHNDIRSSSVGAILYFALVLAAWGMMRGRQAVLGMALALATWVKLTPLALVAYVAWRGARRASLIALILLGLSMVAALWHWGWDIVPSYLFDALLPAAKREVPWVMNQSLDGVLSRALVTNPYVQAFVDVPVLKQVLSVGIGLGLFFVTLRSLQRRRHPALLPVELGLATVTMLLLMKITWVHTLTAMLFVWPTLMMPILAAALQNRPWAMPAGLLACLGFFLSSAHAPIFWHALRHGPQQLLIGVHFFGLLLLWWVSRLVLARQATLELES